MTAMRISWVWNERAINLHNNNGDREQIACWMTLEKVHAIVFFSFIIFPSWLTPGKIVEERRFALWESLWEYCKFTRMRVFFFLCLSMYIFIKAYMYSTRLVFNIKKIKYLYFINYRVSNTCTCILQEFLVTIIFITRGLFLFQRNWKNRVFSMQFFIFLVIALYLSVWNFEEAWSIST